jgi:di/tricarboxylate transporter
LLSPPPDSHAIAVMLLTLCALVLIAQERIRLETSALLVLVGVTLSAKTSPSAVLMPFGLATVIGGTVTTIGTSTNLRVVSVARDLGVREFGMFNFALPMAYQTNLLVMHAGGYRFMDFVRVGVPLTVLMLAAYVVVIPRFFPF